MNLKYKFNIYRIKQNNTGVQLKEMKEFHLFNGSQQNGSFWKRFSKNYCPCFTGNSLYIICIIILFSIYNTQFQQELIRELFKYRIQIFVFIYLLIMGVTAGGALNTVGFSHAIDNNVLPSYQHITHSGTYNQHFFNVGHKAKQLLQLHYELGVSNCDLFAMDKRNYFLTLFLKSSKDGQPRTRSINACVVLDISGSMNSMLDLSKPCQKTRLMLARDAIFMLYQKLKGDDIFSLVVFHNNARTIIQSNYVSMLDKQEVRAAIYQNFESGGTTIKQGFNEALKQINRFRSNLNGYENRIVMLTDVNDNSVANEQQLIQDISNNQQVGTTIIGVSSDFRSETCQKLKQVKDFNYLCAVQNSDLQTYLADRFDYTFFPCAEKICIKIISDDIKDIKVYGSADEQKMKKKQKNGFIVSQFESAFPSELVTNEDKENIESLGGLILVKFIPDKAGQLPVFNIKLLLSYQNLSGQQYTKQYVIQQKIAAEEYYSGSASKKGVSLFYYAESMRNLLKIMGDSFTNASKPVYIQNLEKLKEYCPESKKIELEKVIKIVEEKQEVKKI